MIDTHCHLNHSDYSGDLQEVIKRAEDVGVDHIVCVGYDFESSVQALKLAREIRMISAAVGIHPHDAAAFSSDMEAQLREMATSDAKVVAIGEAGLDYYRDLSPRKAQQAVFRRHIAMARELNLPLIVHSRDAHSDVLAILDEEGFPSCGVVMHCLPADREFALKSVELGCYLGIGGAITFKNAQLLREIVSQIPLDHLILETDAPYLTPHPHRGQRNEPSYLPMIAESLANTLGITPGEVCARTTANARELFGL